MTEPKTPGKSSWTPARLAKFQATMAKRKKAKGKARKNAQPPVEDQMRVKNAITFLNAAHAASAKRGAWTKPELLAALALIELKGEL